AEGTGFDRTEATGSGFTGLYPRPWRKRYESTATCPDDLLLFMHWVPYAHRLRSGKTVIQHIYDTHFTGVDRIDRFRAGWSELSGKVDRRRHAAIEAGFEAQRSHATFWRDTVVGFFFDRSRVVDAEREWLHVALNGPRVLLGGRPNLLSVAVTNASARDRDITVALRPPSAGWHTEPAERSAAGAATAELELPVTPPLPGTVAAPDRPDRPDRPGRIRLLLSRLYVQCLLAVLAGVVVGSLWPSFGAELKPLGDGFVALVRMMIAPIIFCTVVHGIAAMSDRRAVGRVSLKALVYFEILTTIALVIGLVVVNVVRPGSGLHVDVSTLSTDSLPAEATQAHESFTDFVLSTIPDTLVSALTGEEILPVLLVAVLFGFGLQASGEAGAGIAAGVEKLSTVLFRLIRWIMRLAPVGAFGSMAFTIGNYGLGTLRHLALLVGSFWLTALFFVVVVLGAVMRLGGLRLLPFLRYIKEELLIVLGTSSTEPVLPRMMAKLEHAGASKPVVGITLPAGYSFNLDGTAIYLT
ncbi:cation:dicarboxylase symporter family transporter, partial [Streptomyces albiflaviniger]|nr:cation:dicarboxylase symporter family transporter [Streptomyces albiflaviniger]